MLIRQAPDGILCGLKLKALADRLECRLEGNGDLDIRGVAGIEQAADGELTFFANPKYAAKLASTRATAVIVGRSAPAAPCATLHADDPYLAFAHAVALFAPPLKTSAGTHPLADVDPSAIVAADASVGPFVSIGPGARIGARTVVFPHVTIGEGAVVGDDCLIHARVSIRERVSVGQR